MIIGVDEVGRGCLFGPVVSAAVSLGPDYKNLGLTDSKKLTPSKRKKIYTSLYEGAHKIAIGIASPQEIDEINIFRASLLSMKRAVEKLCSEAPQFADVQVLVDGKFTIPGLNSHYDQEAIVKGDLKNPSIAAASIIAKVYRDELVEKMEEAYPGYGLKSHKGYPTKVHKEALVKLGATKEHRKSFKGVGAL